jgi:hypothetical protein
VVSLLARLGKLVVDACGWNCKTFKQRCEYYSHNRTARIGYQKRWHTYAYNQPSMLVYIAAFLLLAASWGGGNKAEDIYLLLV